MKKLLLALSLIGLSVAHAHGPYRSFGWHSGYYGCGGCWVAPAVIGGVVGYEIANRPVIIEQPPVIYTQPNVIQQPPLGYHWQEMIDPATNVRKIVLVPN
jgi:hypothetical protein